VAVDVANGYIVSCGADGTIQLHALATRRLLGNHTTQAVCHCLEYVPALKMAFVGTSTGEVLGLAATDTALSARLAFSGHKGPCAAAETS
jgi:hypothetical protein